MSAHTSSAGTPLPASGDALVKRSRQMLSGFAVLALISAAIYLFVRPLWSSVSAQEGAPFMLGATLFGLGLTVPPLAALVCLTWGVFARVESMVRPRSTPIGPLDRVVLGLGVLLSLVPAAWPLSMAARAVWGGTITIRQPIEHTFSAGVDPLSFTENVGYWLMATALLATGAWLYWRSRRRLWKQLHTH